MGMKNDDYDITVLLAIGCVAFAMCLTCQKNDDPLPIYLALAVGSFLSAISIAVLRALRKPPPEPRSRLSVVIQILCAMIAFGLLLGLAIPVRM